MNSTTATNPAPRHGPADRDELYRTTPPWDIGRPQPAFVRLADTGRLTGHVLDIGCGTGEHALLAASLGFEATGIDRSEQAIELARHKARARGLQPLFLRHDALRLGELGEQFDTVLDCGLFHLFDSATRAAFIEELGSVLRPGGHYFMLGISSVDPGRWTGHSLSRNDIAESFTTGWRVDAVADTTLEIIPAPGRVAAWLAEITRI